MKHILFWIVFIAAMGGIAWNTRRLISYLKVGKKENRFDRIGERIRNVLVIAIGQSKLMRDPVAGSIHAMIFWGFLVLLAAVVESLLEGLFPGANLNWLGPVYSVLTISQDIFCVLILVGVVWAFWRRYVTRVKRLQGDEAEKKDATLILALIGVIVSSLLVMNASRLGAGEEYSWAVRPVGALLHPLLANPSTALGVFEATWWLHIVTILGFMNYLPYSKHLHVMTSVPNVYFGALETVNKLKKIDFEEEALSPQTYAEELGRMEQQGRTMVHTVAIAPTGEVVGYNDLVVSADDPEEVMQWGTLVRREHRGHRLGMAVKVRGLQELARFAPQARRIQTCNAEQNAHMVGVNVELGFRKVEVLLSYQRHLDA